ncbi:MAG: hypothetical protein PHX43_03805 [Alphaproteobacteria bacterium]|nr:hypothetical protein [Alphaproteobacteria bacterium]
MGNNVDNRVVEMQFDNAQFERGVKTSLSSLDKLKQGLRLDDSAKSLKNLERTASRFSMSNVGAGVEALNQKFSAMGIVGITALQNITTAAMRAGKQMIKSLTLDPITTGFNEYEIKMEAIKTILTNTAAKGTSLDDVNASLADLNTYADKTIYNFAQMTDMVGKFAAKTGDLDSSVSIVKGLANLAAFSGVSNTKLQGALYQVSNMAEKVRSLDWMSMETAGLATVKFKDDLIAMAKTMGTVSNKTLADLNSGAIAFRDTLADGWLTQGVFAAVTDMYALDQAMTDAAGEVTTFTKLFGVMREAVQSGWAQTWELIVGDKVEASRMLTDISRAFEALIGPSTEARNSMFSFWKENDGRWMLIESLVNIFSALRDVLSPISEAFQEIFPKEGPAGSGLLKMTEALRDFTRGLVISDNVLSGIRNAFKGFFAVLDIGWEILKVFGELITPIIKAIFPMSEGLIVGAGALGEWLVAVRNTIKDTDGIRKAFSKVGEVFIWVAAVIKVLIDRARILGQEIKASFAKMNFSFTGFKIPDFSGLVEFFNIVKEMAAGPLNKIKSFFSGLGTVLKDIGKTLSEGFATGNLKDIFVTGFGAGLAVYIVKSVKNFFDKFTPQALGLDKFGEIFLQFGETMEAFQHKINAEALKTVAIAIALLAGSLLLIASIDNTRLAGAMASITILFVDLFGAMALFQRAIEDKGVVKLGALASSMVGVSVAMLILAGAFKKVAQLDWDQIIGGLVSIAGITGIMLWYAKSMETYQGSLIKSSLGLNAFAAAIYILVGVIERLGAIDAAVAIQGLVMLTLVVGQLAIFMIALRKAEAMTVSTGVGLLGVAAAIYILSGAVKALGSLPPNVWTQGMLGVGALIAIFGGFIAVAGEKTKALAAAGAVAIMSASLLLIIPSLKLLGTMPWEELLQGMIALAAIVSIFAIVSKQMDDNLKGAGAMAIMAGALLLLVPAISTFAKIPWRQLATATGVLVSLIFALSVAAKIADGSVKGAAALIVVATAVNMMAGALMLFSLIPIEQVGTSLLVLAGSLLAMALTAKALEGMSAGLMKAGVGLLAIGAGLALSGGAMLLFSMGLVTLAAAGIPAVEVLIYMVKKIIELIPYVMVQFGEGIINLIIMLGQAMPHLTATLVAMGDTIIDTFFGIIDSFSRALVKYVPKFTEDGMLVIKGFLKGIEDHLEEVVILANLIIADFLNGMAESLDEVIDAGFKLLVAFIEGMAQAIDQNTKPLVDASNHLIMSLINAAVTVLLGQVELLKRTGQAIIETGLFDGIGEKLKGLGDYLLTEVILAFGKLGEATDEFIDAGKDVVNGFILGVEEQIKNVKDAARDLGNSLLTELGFTLDINSPSEETKKLGIFGGEGFVEGLKSLIPDIKAVATEMGTTTLGGIFDVFKNNPFKSKTATKIILDPMTNLPIEVAVDNTRTSGWDYVVQAKQKIADELAAANDKAEEEASKAYSGANFGGSSNAASSAKAVKSAFDLAVESIDERKYYSQLSLEEELAAWEDLQRTYEEGSEERKRIDREVYRVQNELRKDGFEFSKKWIEKEKYYNRLSLEDELAAWERVQARYLAGSAERIEADREVYRVRQELEKREEERIRDAYEQDKQALEDRRYFNQLTLADELAMLQEMQDAYADNAEIRKELDREVFRVSQEIAQKREVLDRDYTDNVARVNAQLEADISAINDEYVRSLDSRTKALYGAYGLFSKVQERTDVPTGEDLFMNLHGQVEEFRNWQENLNALAGRGITDEMLKELQDMGPSAAGEIASLNKMSDEELTDYATLWQVKYNLAHTQAIDELETMREDSIVVIQEMREEANAEITLLQNDYQSALTELNTATSKELTKFQNEWKERTTAVKNQTKETVSEIVEDVEHQFTEPNWVEMGANIIRGITKGVKDNAIGLANATAEAAEAALAAAKLALGIKSPSTKFEKVGEQADQGFANGISKFAYRVYSEASSLGDSALSALRATMSSLSAIINDEMDTDPVIRPVLDLSDIVRGNSLISSMMGQPALALGVSGYSLAGKVAMARSATNAPPAEAVKVASGPPEITNQFMIETMNIRNEADIKHVARQLYQLQVAESRG